MDKSIPLTVGVMILLASAGTLYYLTDLENTYYCEAKNTVAMCEKLSTPNKEGISSRCYYNSTKYFICDSGWKPIKEFPEIIQNLTIMGYEEKDIEEEIAIPIIEPILNKTIENRTFYILEVTKYPDIPSSKIMKCEWKGEL